jgi:crotonobetainyl-CoA:carnitine CoA-transferase CaiB-like acyl-CoA transferase
VRNRDELDKLITDWTSKAQGNETWKVLQLAGVPASPVQTIGDLFDDEHLTERRWIQYTEHPEAGTVPHTRAAFTLSETPARIERAAPLFGQDNRSILSDLLRLEDRTIEQAYASGVVRDEPPSR